jgi:preprotein translocase subunit SecG
MRKRQINAIIDLALLVSFLVIALSSIVLFFFLPSGGGGWGFVHAGTGATNLRVFLGVTRGDWVDLHNITGILFMVLMAVHILLHIPYYRNIRSCLSSVEKEACDRE